VRTARLFLDWIHVDEGLMEATLDQQRISDEGRAIIERNKKKRTKLSSEGLQ